MWGRCIFRGNQKLNVVKIFWISKRGKVTFPFMIKEVTEADRILHIPTHFHDYRYIRTIGTGTSSVVVLVTNEINNKLYACKVVSRKELEISGNLKRFEQETRVHSFLQHPNILEIIEIIYEKDLIFIITEYCQCGELFLYIITHPDISEETTQKFFVQILRAVVFLHERLISHRDLKPENILLDSNMNIKLADFGFCMQTKSHNMLLSTPCGSPFYAAPEIVAGQMYDGKKADVWSLGVVLYTMATASLPWTSTVEEELYHQISHGIFQIPSCVSKECREVILACMQVDPNKRPIASQISNFKYVSNYFYQKTRRLSCPESKGIASKSAINPVKSYIDRNILVIKPNINTETNFQVREPISSKRLSSNNATRSVNFHVRKNKLISRI